jgi:hypothetical protein
MNNKQFFLAALAFTTLMAGCKQSNQPSNSSDTTDGNSTSVTQQLENAREVATNAWQETKNATTNVVESIKEGSIAAWTDIEDSMQSTNDYPFDKKDAFVAVAGADLGALDLKMTELSDKAAAAADSIKSEAQAKLLALHEKRMALDKKLDDVKNATEADWNATKVGFMTSYDATKTSLKQTWQWLADKLNP